MKIGEMSNYFSIILIEETCNFIMNSVKICTYCRKFWETMLLYNIPWEDMQLLPHILGRQVIIIMNIGKRKKIWNQHWKCPPPLACK
jgi:hypothetical protein